MTALRWLTRIGWLVIVVAVGLAVIVGTSGNASESELVDGSLYIALALGFGAGLIVGARSQSTASGSTAGRVVGTLVMALALAGGFAFSRWYILTKFFY